MKRLIALLLCILFAVEANAVDASFSAVTNVAEGGSVTAGSGSNRFLAIAICKRAFVTGRTITAMSLGSSSIANGKITQTVFDEFEETAGNFLNCGIWRIKEADIPGGANTLSATWSGSTDGTNQFSIITVQDVDQTNPIDGSPTVYNGAAATSHTGTISIAAGSVQVLLGGSPTSSSITCCIGTWVEREDVLSTIRHQTQTDAHSSADASLSWEFNNAGTQTANIVIVSFAKVAAAAGVTVTDVDSDEVLTATQTNFVTTGTGFNASQGTGTETIIDGAITCTVSIDTWADTSIQGDMCQGNVRFGARTLRVTDNEANQGELGITLNPQAGHLYKDIETLDTLTWGGALNLVPNRITTKGWASDPAPDHCASVVQFEMWVTGGSGTFTMQTNGAVTDIDDDVTQLTFRCHDGSIWSANTVWDIGGL